MTPAFLQDLPEICHVWGFSLRKAALLKKFLPVVKMRRVSDFSEIPDGGTVFIWGVAQTPELNSRAIKRIRVEDGFIRSVGLGADLVRPISWVFDDQGIYFDASQPSRLEQLLQEYPFDADLIHRANCLVDGIVAAGLSKYNVGQSHWAVPQTSKKLILVPGQVETDASIRMGALGISSNIALLKAVRLENPDAYVIYKPHPDVLAGLREKGILEHEAIAYCDELVSDVAITQLLAVVDEVHVMTSLTGFEALLRGRQVVCYGLPFYAGWGLTSDKLICERRNRRLTMQELAAAALILYPSYISLQDDSAIRPEQALQQLLNSREQAAHKAWHMPDWLQKMRRHWLKRP